MTWFQKPYPLISYLRQKLLVVGAFSVFTVIFLWVYQPFGGSDITQFKFLFLSGFGVCVGFGLSITYLLLPKLLPRVFDPEKWTTGKEIGYVSVSFLLISALNAVYNATVGSEIAPQQTFLGFVGITFSVGFFPLLAMIFLSEQYLSKRNAAIGVLIKQRIETAPQPQSSANKEIELYPDSGPPFPVDFAHFLYAEAEGNYTRMFFSEADGSVSSRFERITLKQMEQQFAKAAVSTIARVHKSFLINTQAIRDVRGNARSSEILLHGTSAVIPVSRSFALEKLQRPAGS
jgi:hypothetical protein